MYPTRKQIAKFFCLSYCRNIKLFDKPPSTLRPSQLNKKYLVNMIVFTVIVSLMLNGVLSKSKSKDIGNGCSAEDNAFLIFLAHRFIDLETVAQNGGANTNDLVTFMET